MTPITDQLVESINQIARAAGRLIMEYYDVELTVQSKKITLRSRSQTKRQMSSS